ncbi:MAG TPA: hypothetical protein VGO91_14735 [Pyrinomonadaceae bacterium]|nr:hypothetical protein [Pyrinomonadaceae bacterium]
MRIKFIASCLALLACCSLSARAQQPAGTTNQAQSAPAEQRVALAEKAIALDATGRAALAGGLLTTTLNGSNDAPVRNARLVIENRSADFFTYISGWATFYDAAGVRCGEGMFKLDALATQESAETDTPGLRLTCAPTTWRIVALNLLTRAGDTARPILPAQVQSTNSTNAEQTPPATAQTGATAQPDATTNALPLFVNISIDGRAYRVPLGSTLEIPVNKKRTKITVSASPQ